MPGRLEAESIPRRDWNWRPVNFPLGLRIWLKVFLTYSQKNKIIPACLSGFLYLHIENIYGVKSVSYLILKTLYKNSLSISSRVVCLRKHMFCIFYLIMIVISILKFNVGRIFSNSYVKPTVFAIKGFLCKSFYSIPISCVKILFLNEYWVFSSVNRYSYPNAILTEVFKQNFFTT